MAAPSECCLLEQLDDSVLRVVLAACGPQSTPVLRVVCVALRDVVDRSLSTLSLRDAATAAAAPMLSVGDTLALLERHLAITRLSLPDDWSGEQVKTLCTSPRARLAGIELPLRTLTPSSCAALAAAAPLLRAAHLRARSSSSGSNQQAARVRALACHHPQLASLACDAPLGPDALGALAELLLPSLSELRLLPPSPSSAAQRSSHHHRCYRASAGDLFALARLTSLTSLEVRWAAGRTLQSAAPLAALTRLRRLHVWLGGGGALPRPPSASRPLAGLLPAAAALPALTELQLLSGLRGAGDVAALSALAALPSLSVLGLADTRLCEAGLAALQGCSALRVLRVDSLALCGGQLTVAAGAPTPAPTPPLSPRWHAAARDTVAAVAAAVGLRPPSRSASPVAAAAASAADALLASSASAGPALPQLRVLECNAVGGAAGQLHAAFPNLAAAGPYREALWPAAAGGGWAWLLSAHGHARLARLRLTLCAAASAAGAAPEVLRGVLASLPALTVIEIVGAGARDGAGGGECWEGAGGCDAGDADSAAHALRVLLLQAPALNLRRLVVRGVRCLRESDAAELRSLGDGGGVDISILHH